MDRERIAHDLKRHEGWRATAYQDHLGYWTVGYGFLIDDRKSGGMPKEIGAIWLNYNLDMLERALRAALPKWERYPDGVQAALANMAYQMGLSGLLGFKQTLRLIDDGRYLEAADEAMDSRWAQQTPERAREVTAWIADAGQSA